MTRRPLTSGASDSSADRYGLFQTVRFFPSGCPLLDCVLGGGWAVGRTANIVGDRSSGKTLLATEACVNFAMTFKDSPVRYCESESAFDPKYAESIGMPFERVSFVKLRTVEEVEEDLRLFMKPLKKGDQALYVLDSLDALSNATELEASESGGGQRMAGKAAAMSSMFRQLIQDMEERGVTFLVVSQVRENIGVTFGRAVTRTGGRALDFYASQVIYLAAAGKLTKTIRGVESQIGGIVKVKNDKNKVGRPYKECEFPILYYYGIDDITACVSWLAKVNESQQIGFEPGADKGRDARIRTFVQQKYELPPAEVVEYRKTLGQMTMQIWEEIYSQFDPKIHKYT